MDAPLIESPVTEIRSSETRRARLFISYSRKDRLFVERLSEALKAVDLEVWVDLLGILPSEDWMNAIHSAIEGADAFVFIVSPDSVDPDSICAREIDHALTLWS